MQISIKLSTYIFIFCAIFTLNSSAIYRVSVASGNWANAGTWSPAGAPLCGDSIVVQSTHTVSFTNQQNYNSCNIPMRLIIYGALKFYNGSKLSLPCGSYVVVLGTGSIEADNGLANSNFIEVCNIVEWNSNAPLNGPACFPPNPICPSLLVILPVELINFNAETCIGNKICLNWETASEKNNGYYEIERSADAIDFISVLKVFSKAPGGNSQNKISYTASDADPLAGINYYRLKQIDKNQLITYSKIISVRPSEENIPGILIFPNSNSGQFTAQITGLKQAANVTLLLRDPAGELIYQARHYLDDHSLKIKVLPENKLTTGIYFCSLIIDNVEYVQKVIVADN